MSDRYIDFETKKTFHFNITRATHAELRITCFKKRLSMQEVFEEMSQRIAAGSPDMINILDDLSQKKRDRTIKKLSQTDAESLFDVIAQESPLSED